MAEGTRRVGGRIWRRIALLLIGGILGTAFGVALGFFLFPYVFPPPPAAETITEEDRSALVATGTFVHADPTDPIHYGKARSASTRRPCSSNRTSRSGPGRSAIRDEDNADRIGASVLVAECDGRGSRRQVVRPPAPRAILVSADIRKNCHVVLDNGIAPFAPGASRCFSRAVTHVRYLVNRDR